MSSHGLGHATRLVGVIQQLCKSFSHIDILLFGQTPDWFWSSNLPHNCKYRQIHAMTDIGLVQDGPFHHDIKKTQSLLLEFLRFREDSLVGILQAIDEFKPTFILSDISPLGVWVGHRLQIPNILLENFTWDWIYQEYLEEDPQFEKIIEQLIDIYQMPDLRLQSTPVCDRRDGCVQLEPIFREPTLEDKEIHTRLGLEPDEKYVLLTTGGIAMPQALENISCPDFHVVVPGDYPKVEKFNRFICIPMNAGMPFPDLVASSCCVIGKAGYGTIAECWGTGIPFLGVFRESFRESSVLLEFCLDNLHFQEITLDSFLHHSWQSLLKEFLNQKTAYKNRSNGAIQATAEIIHFIGDRED